VSRQRLNKKLAADTIATPPYSTKSSQNRAKRRAESALPSSPRKRRRIIEDLATTIGMINITSGHERQPVTPVNNIPAEVCGRVRYFYLRSDISWTAPGRKDCITVVRDGKKVQEQRRYLLTTISELYALYVEEYPDDSIKLTSFKSLCPDTVLYKSEMPHNICVCQYHENINLILQAVSPLGTPSNHRDFVQSVVRDIESEECMFGRCTEWQQKASLDSLCDFVPEDKLNDTVKWFLWARLEDNQARPFQYPV
jgi:hypothetical protein